MGAIAEIGGGISVNPSVKPNTTYKITFRGSKGNIRVGYDSVYLVNSDGVISTVNGSANISKMTQGVVYTEDYSGVDVTFTTQADTVKMWFSILFNPAGTYIANADELVGLVLTLEELSTSGDSGEVKPFVNIVPTLLDTDLTNVFNGIGYQKLARINSSGGITALEASNKTTLTGLIPLEKDGDVLHVRGVDRVAYIDGRHVGWCSLWDSTGAFLAYNILFPSTMIGTDENGDFAMTIDYATLKVNEYPTASYIRLQLGEVTGELIIARNQLITVNDEI